MASESAQSTALYHGYSTTPDFRLLGVPSKCTHGSAVAEAAGNRQLRANAAALFEHVSNLHGRGPVF